MNHLIAFKNVIASAPVEAALSLALVFSYIGFLAPLPLIITGYVFALVGGFVGLAALPVEDMHPKLWWEVTKTVITALFIATLMGVVQPRLGAVLPNTGVLSAFRGVADEGLLPWSMGVSGIVSRWLAKRFSRGDLSLPRLGVGGGSS